MNITLEKYPEFIAVQLKHPDAIDRRVLIIRPGEELILPNLRLSYLELLSSPRIIAYQLE